MAKIDTPEIEVGLGGSDYVQAGVQQAVDTTPEQIKIATDAALAGFKEFKVDRAETSAKSLLEEFTGFGRKKAIMEQEDALLEEEATLADTIQSGATEGGPQFDVAVQRQAHVKRALDDLAVQRDAVEQGLLSYDEYRRRAEMMFYQQVALTPGLREEIAGAMGEFLGIDPRGQTAALMIEQRKAEAKSDADDNAKMVTQLVAEGLWDDNQTREQNFQQFGPIWRQRTARAKEIERKTKELEFADKLSTAKLKQLSSGLMQDVVAITPQAMAKLNIGPNGLKVSELTSADVINMDKQVNADWRNQIQIDANTFKRQLREWEMMSQGNFKADAHIASVDDRVALLDRILAGKLPQEQLQQQIEMLKNQNEIAVQTELTNLLSHKEVVQLAAINDALGGETLPFLIQQNRVVMELLSGVAPRKKGMPEEEWNERVQAYHVLIQKMDSVWTAPDTSHVDDSFVTVTGDTLGTILKHSPTELQDDLRRRAFKLMTSPSFMTRLKQHDPGTFNELARHAEPHIEALESNLQKKLAAQLETSGRDFGPQDLYLKKADNMWILSATDNAATPRALREGTRLSGTIDPAQKEALIAERERAIVSQTASLNTTGTLNDLIKARSLLFNVPEEEAARWVAGGTGISLKNTPAVAERTQGLGEKFKNKQEQPKVDPTAELIKELADAVPGATLSEITDFIESQRTPEEIRRDDDFQPATEGVRPRPGDADFSAN